MSAQARRISPEVVPGGAEGLYYNEGLFSEVLVHHGEAVYFEHGDKGSGIVRFSFEMPETLKQAVEDEANVHEDPQDAG